MKGGELSLVITRLMPKCLWSGQKLQTRVNSISNEPFWGFSMIKPGTVIPYLKKFQKTFKLRDALLKFCWYQHFFTGNQQILLYQEIRISIVFWYIISNHFNFFWVFKVCFNKQTCSFDDVSKIGYSRP